MAVKQVPQTWQSEDGKEFDSQAAAEAHDKLDQARRDYENARRHFGRLLAETQKTADGQPFDLSMSNDYYYIVPGYHGMPRLAQVSFYIHYCHFSFDSFQSDTEQMSVVMCEGNDPKKSQDYRISQLYRRKEAAERALLAERERWLEQATKEIAELRDSLKGKR